MISEWTKEEIESVLVQLNEKGFPFNGYEFMNLGKGLLLLGSGASAQVYAAISHKYKKREYAIKVIGFGDKHVDSKVFREAVEIQKDLLGYDYNTVRVYDSLELRVWIESENTVTKVEKIENYEEARLDGKYLHLQFVLMEKLLPVLDKTHYNNALPLQRLRVFNEKEILKFAYDIGNALDSAHKKNLIHRDIKLENVFWDSSKKKYKLGDFGIAKVTDDGLASTVAFTKGYGAPEVVGTLDDRYDCTADIYSFGMMLYILLNELRFPESENYHPNVYQYLQGYIPPEPVNGSDELVNIVLKMLSFSPDDRYQSMEEVINEIVKLRYGYLLKYQREHKSSSFMIGTAFALIGMILLKLSFEVTFNYDFSLMEYIFWGLCLLKSIFGISKNRTELISTGIFGVGIYLLISSSFSITKLLLLFAMLILNYEFIGITSLCAITANITYLIMQNYSLLPEDFFEYRWLAVLFCTLSVSLYFIHYLLGERDEKILKIYFSKNIMWFIITLYYVLLFFWNWIMEIMSIDISMNPYYWILGEEKINWIMSWKPGMVGIVGTFFWLGWIMREIILSYIEKQREI